MVESHPFMVITGMVYYCFASINHVVVVNLSLASSAANQVTGMAFKETLHFLWICFGHGMGNDGFHLELRLAPDFLHRVPMSYQHPPGQPLVMSIAC